MTLAALSKMICLAWVAYGRAPLSEAECDGRARLVRQAAERHQVDPVLMLSVDVQECDLRDTDAPIYEVVRGRRTVVGYDRCPMGVRVMGTEKDLGASDLYDLAAQKIKRWERWCRAGHPGGKYRGRGSHHHLAHYNPGNPVYAHQVLAFAAVLRGRPVSPADAQHLTGRSREIIRRLVRTLARGPRRSS